MFDLLIETGAKLYDALIRGACWAVSLTVVWIIAAIVVRRVPPIMRSLGVWP